jgi:hypothetical protein
MTGHVLGAAAQAHEPGTRAASGPGRQPPVRGGGRGQRSQPRCRSGPPGTEPSGPGAKLDPPPGPHPAQPSSSLDPARVPGGVKFRLLASLTAQLVPAVPPKKNGEKKHVRCVGALLGGSGAARGHALRGPLQKKTRKKNAGAQARGYHLSMLAFTLGLLPLPADNRRRSQHCLAASEFPLQHLWRSAAAFLVQFALLSGHSGRPRGEYSQAKAAPPWALPDKAHRVRWREGEDTRSSKPSVWG